MTEPQRAETPITFGRAVTLNIAVVAAYVVAATIGFRLAFVAEQITTVWAPTGIALAALFAGGRSPCTGYLGRSADRQSRNRRTALDRIHHRHGKRAGSRHRRVVAAQIASVRTHISADR